MLEGLRGWGEGISLEKPGPLHFPGQVESSWSFSGLLVSPAAGPSGSLVTVIWIETQGGRQMIGCLTFLDLRCKIPGVSPTHVRS